MKFSEINLFYDYFYALTMQFYLLFYNIHSELKYFIWLNICIIAFYIVLMLISHKFVKLKEYLPNIFKTINLIVTYENALFLINENKEIFGFLIGYFTALYTNN